MAACDVWRSVLPCRRMLCHGLLAAAKVELSLLCVCENQLAGWAVLAVLMHAPHAAAACCCVGVVAVLCVCWLVASISQAALAGSHCLCVGLERESSVVGAAGWVTEMSADIIVHTCSTWPHVQHLPTCVPSVSHTVVLHCRMGVVATTCCSRLRFLSLTVIYYITCCFFAHSFLQPAAGLAACALHVGRCTWCSIHHGTRSVQQPCLLYLSSASDLGALQVHACSVHGFNTPSGAVAAACLPATCMPWLCRMTPWLLDRRAVQEGPMPGLGGSWHRPAADMSWFKEALGRGKLRAVAELGAGHHGMVTCGQGVLAQELVQELVQHWLGGFRL